MKPTPKKPSVASEPEAVIAEAIEVQPAEAVIESGPSAKDSVRITMLETVSPPPIIGSFNSGLALGVTRLEMRKTYLFPRDAAARMQDTGLAVMLQDH